MTTDFVSSLEFSGLQTYNLDAVLWKLKKSGGFLIRKLPDW
jgi:hypothetical protein